MFIRIIQEANENQIPPVSAVTIEMLRNYKDTLLKLPIKRSSDLTSSIEQLISSGQKPISSKTATENLTLVGSFLDWAELDGYPIKPELRKIFTTYIKASGKQQDRKERDLFDAGELKKLFESERYHDSKIERSSDYWAPLISLFTGARMGEILQLKVSDIREKNGIWIFDINDDGDSHIKSPAGKRMVPIHSQLIKMGFIEFSTAQSKLSERLFPEEERNSNGNFRAYSGRFRSYRNSVWGYYPGRQTAGFSFIPPHGKNQTG